MTVVARYWRRLHLALSSHVGGGLILDVASSVAGNTYAALAALGAGAFLARWLGPELRGVFELGLFAANLALLVLGFGLNVPTTVFITQQPARGAWAFRAGVRLAMVYGVLGTVVLVVGRRGSGVASRVPFLLGIAVLGVFLSQHLLQLVNGKLIGLGRISWQNVAVATRWSVYLGGVLALSLLASPSPEAALLCYTAGAFAATVVGWVRFPLGQEGLGSGALAGRERWEVVWFGLRAQFANLFQFASYRFDVLLVGLWVGKVGLGVYAVGVMFSEALWLLPNAVGTVLLSHTSRFSRDQADQRIGYVFTVTMGLVLLGAIGLGFLSLFVARYYLGRPYAGVPLVTALLIPGAIALSATKLLANELTARGFPGVNTVTSLCGAIVTLVGDVVLIPRYGILGAAVASSIGYSCACVVSWIAFRQRSVGSLIVLHGR